MTIDEAIEYYTATALAIFSRSNRKAAFKRDGSKATTLENRFKDRVAAKAPGGCRMIGFKSERGSGEGRAQSCGCRTFVCAMPAHNIAHPQRFCIYRVCENARSDRLIWQAALATMATPTFFKPVALGAAPSHAPQAFINSGLRCNNPVREVMDEVRAVFGGTARLGCLASIGAGHADFIGLAARCDDPSAKRLLTSLVKALKSVATDCEKEAQSVARQFRDPPDWYFRFSVAHGIGAISLDERERLDEVTQHTEAFLKDAEVTRTIDQLVKLLCGTRDTDEEGSSINLYLLCKSQGSCAYCAVSGFSVEDI
jgi:hypothetical protein